MSKLQRMALWLSVLGAAAGIDAGTAQAAPSEADSVGCAVSRTGGELDADALCRRMGVELGRSVVRVADARVVRHGGAVQVVRGEAEWFVAWLRDGKVTAWTRVSQQAAFGHELETLAHASHFLAMQAQALDGRCVEVGRSSDRASRSNDLVHPWQELHPCQGPTSDLVDPWLARR